VTDERLRQIAGHGWLTGWKAIASYVGVHIDTAKKYKKEFSMPVHYLPGGTPMCLPREIDIWAIEYSKRAKKPS